MKCPYCGKDLCVPTVVYKHTERYGTGIKHFCCVFCTKVISANCEIAIIITNLKKSNKKSDWG